jgi:hypothetical protein
MGFDSNTELDWPAGSKKGARIYVTVPRSSRSWTKCPRQFLYLMASELLQREVAQQLSREQLIQCALSYENTLIPPPTIVLLLTLGGGQGLGLRASFAMPAACTIPRSMPANTS